MAGVKPPIAPGALAATSEYRPPFYSAVEQAVQGAKQNAAPGQQWAGFLRNQPGVKPEEVEALKLGQVVRAARFCAQGGSAGRDRRQPGECGRGDEGRGRISIRRDAVTLMSRILRIAGSAAV